MVALVVALRVVVVAMIATAILMNSLQYSVIIVLKYLRLHVLMMIIIVSRCFRTAKALIRHPY